MALRPALDELLELRHQAHALGIASRHLVGSSFAGVYASVFRGQGLDFEEVREYHEGDDIRSMDWKVTARTNEPHLKLYREERERSVLLCVDQGPRMQFGTRGTFKAVQAARAAALIGWAASRMHDRVGGILYGAQPQHFRPTKDRRALWRLLKALAEEPGTSPDVPDALAGALRRADRGAPTGSLVFVIGDLVSSPSGTKWCSCRSTTLPITPCPRSAACSSAAPTTPCGRWTPTTSPVVRPTPAPGASGEARCRPCACGSASCSRRSPPTSTCTAP